MNSENEYGVKGDTLALYLGEGPGFRSWPEDQLF
jgi:hypothetical protein